MKKLFDPKLFAFFGFLAMTIFYFAILTATTGDPTHPFYFFAEKWYFFAPIFGGFAWQMFLFQKLRIVTHENNTKMAGASAGASGVAMAACCAHHLAELFPILGFFGAATFVGNYQNYFLGASVFINLFGVAFMFFQLQKHKKMACCTT